MNKYSMLFKDNIYFLSNYSLIGCMFKKYGIPDFKKTLMNNMISLKRYSDIKISKRLNIFEQLKPSETKHSLILSNLLNPKGNHGCGDLFLKIFFEVFPLDPIKISSNDIWEVTAEKERFDIRIRNTNSTKIIIIENKSNWADDKENQLYRYWYKGIYLAQLKYENGGIPFFSRMLYLSPSDYQQPSEQSILRPPDLPKDLPDKVPPGTIKIVYFNEHIVKWLDLCLNELNEQHEIYYYLNQYRDYWRLSCHRI
jgi:hypothetical protein